MMLLHAVTDGLVAVAGLFAALSLLPHRRNNIAVFAGIGLGLMGLAAVIGTIKFLFGLQDILGTWHSSLSRMGGITGMALLGLAFLGQIRPAMIRGLPQMPVILVAAALYFGAGALGMDGQLSVPIGGLAMLIAIITGSLLLRGKQIGAALRCYAIALLMLGNGLLTNALFADPLSFHIFHIVLAGSILLIWFHFRPVTIR